MAKKLVVNDQDPAKSARPAIDRHARAAGLS
jgi:hypothetical protein